MGAKQEALPFDYSQAEWSNIEAAARAILPDDKPLPNEVRQELVDRARRFQTGSRVTLAKDNQDWQKVARLSESLHQVLRVASERAVECVRVTHDPREAKRILRWLEAYLEKLLEIKDFAEDMIVPPEWVDRTIDSRTRSRQAADPLRFQRGVLRPLRRIER